MLFYIFCSITVIVAHADDYCKDPEILRGYTDLKIKALAKKKYSPVVVSDIYIFLNLPLKNNLDQMWLSILYKMKYKHFFINST